MRLVRLRGLKLGKPLPVVRFDSNAAEMTKAKHYMYLTKFCELLACQCYSLENLNVCLELTCLFDHFDYDVSNVQELEHA